MPLRIDVGNNDRIMRQGEILMEFVISHLVKNYGSKQVLKDVDFVFEEGRIYGLLGRNGSGKTTFFNCVNGDIDYNSGSFYFRENKDSEDKTALMPQDIGYLVSTPTSNLDEFYIVRVASLRDMQSIDFAERDIAGFSIDEQLERIDQKTRRTMSLMYSTYTRSLVPSLASEKIFLKNYDELSDQLKAIADSYFKAVLYPILTPMAVDSSRPFPLIYNRMLNMCVRLLNEPKKVKLQERATFGLASGECFS